MKTTTNPYVTTAITTRLLTMAAVRVGEAKTLALGVGDRRGQLCARIREISNGGGA
jgi:hypothetical protein